MKPLKSPICKFHLFTLQMGSFLGSDLNDIYARRCRKFPGLPCLRRKKISNKQKGTKEYTNNLEFVPVAAGVVINFKFTSLDLRRRNLDTSFNFHFNQLLGRKRFPFFSKKS